MHDNHVVIAILTPPPFALQLGLNLCISPLILQTILLANSKNQSVTLQNSASPFPGGVFGQSHKKANQMLLKQVSRSRTAHLLGAKGQAFVEYTPHLGSAGWVNSLQASFLVFNLCLETCFGNKRVVVFTPRCRGNPVDAD